VEGFGVLQKSIKATLRKTGCRLLQYTILGPAIRHSPQSTTGEEDKIGMLPCNVIVQGS
jgi:hypothetical protein